LFWMVCALKAKDVYLYFGCPPILCTSLLQSTRCLFACKLALIFVIPCLENFLQCSCDILMAWKFESRSLDFGTVHSSVHAQIRR
jgi:hypothetical protein